MVKVRELHLLEGGGEVALAPWLASLQRAHPLPADVVATLTEAYHVIRALADQSDMFKEERWSASRCFMIGLETATIMSELDQEGEALVAGTLYRAVREERLSLESVQAQFGAGVARLIEGVLRMASVSELQNLGRESVLGRSADKQIENLRKMLVAIIDDVRVALVKIAERTCVIRAAKDYPEDKRRRVAQEVMSVYAPLAHRLGIGHLKWELEDLAFRYLEPEAYKHIARLLDERRLQRQDFIELANETLQAALQQAGVNAEISGRAKHIYSIWRKMRNKGIGFSQVYDIRALRVLVPTVQDCYTSLGIVHGLWRNIPNEFDDYIARPKENGYRSLHTAVIGPEGKVMEVQIRTFDMHTEAEFGVCAHWQYKGSDKSAEPSDSYAAKIEWLRQVLSWHEETGGSLELVQELKSDIVQDRIYVFTPEGHVIDLPAGATVLDFAYHVHTGVGHRCRGSRVNGKVVPLYHVLSTGDQVEIITGKREAPSRDWLTSSLEYLHTQRAKSRVQHWFRQQAKDENIESGRAIVDRAFQRLALANFDFDALVQTLGFVDMDALYEAVGTGELAVSSLLTAAMQHLDEAAQQPARVAAELLSDQILGAEVGGALCLGTCCNPQEGELIIGVVEGDQVVTVHSQSCELVLQLQLDFPEQIIALSWGARRQTFPVEVQVRAYERRGLLRDFCALLDQEQANVQRLNTATDPQTNLVEMELVVEVEDFQQLSRLLEAINQIPNVYQAKRAH